MKAIKIYTQNSKYFMEDLDTNMTTELTNPRFDKKSGKHWFDLPDNSIGQKAICKEMIDEKGEVTRAERTYKYSENTKPTKSTKINYDDHYTEKEAEEVKKHYEAINKINEAVRARVEEAEAMKALEESAMKLTIEQLQAIINAKTEAKA